MKARVMLAAALLAALSSSWLLAEDVAGLPLHVQRLNPKAVRLWLGDYVSSTATVALATSKGIVVIDTLGNPTLDQELRKVIARELGRNDFKYLINTHEHSDHTGGNSVYGDCTIVAHELCGEAMKREPERRQQLLDHYDARLKTLLRETEKLPADSPNAKKFREELALTRLSQGFLQANVKPAPPNLTFRDRMNLDLGDANLEFYYTGGMHSSSDISVFVPEQGLLLTGDTMADAWLNDTPGCLASFTVRPNVAHNWPLLFENWGFLLAKKDQIKDLIPGHWNGDLTVGGFEDRYNYIKTMVEGVGRGVKEGKSLEDLFADFGLGDKFPGLVNSPGFNARNHAGTIISLYSEATGAVSAAEKLYNLINEGAPQGATEQVVAERAAKPAKYIFLEAEINAYGYRFMQTNKFKEAIRLFAINTELFPESWNVYDSLAEAHLKNGDKAMAVQYYEKSVQLNPDNKNGKDALEQLRSAGR